MMLVELTTVPGTAIPVAQFKDHLRLGTGFADTALQDGVLENFLRAALAAIEVRTGKMLFSRSFQWTLTAWRDLGAQALPTAPVTALTSLTITDRLGATDVIAPAKYYLEQDMHRPRLVAASLCLPTIPVGGTATIVFDAGFGAAWSDIPHDLQQAVMLLAAHYYENRSDTTPTGDEIPHGVASLIGRFRNVRLFGGGL
ncbi:MAG TPA: hypothetical protein ENK83_03080 [Aliiroseovarius sp.]|nr:hypothetical protein [Aliiroseovarius sp.]